MGDFLMWKMSQLSNLLLDLYSDSAIPHPFLGKNAPVWWESWLPRGPVSKLNSRFLATERMEAIGHNGRRGFFGNINSIVSGFRYGRR
jgi:hypothetical protein